MTSQFRLTTCLALTLTLALASDAFPQASGTGQGTWEWGAPPASSPPEFALGVGYAHVSIGGSDSPLDSEGALRFDAAFTLSPFEAVPQLRAGVATGLALVLDNTERAIVSDGGLVVFGSSRVPLLLLEPEVRVSWRHPLGDRGMYLEPGLGAGAVIANLDVGTVDEWDASLAARAFLNIGFAVPGGAAGAQVSYMWAEDLDLAGNARGDVDEFYVGVFGALWF